MERLRKLFGGKSADSQNTTGSTTRALKQDGAASEGLVNPSSAPQLQTVQKEDPKAPGLTEHENVTETRMGQLVDEGREMILRVVPLAEGDCLSCKLIGSGVMWGAAGFVLRSYPKVVTKYTGFKRKLFAVQVGSLATALTLLGVARFFDISIFSPPDADSKTKSLGDLIAEDMENFSKVTSKLFSSNTEADYHSKSKRDS